MYSTLESWKLVFMNCDILSKINIVSTCHFLKEHIHIINLSSCLNFTLIMLLTNDILKYDIFKHTTELNIINNKSVTSISHLKNLTKLHACGDCGIDQNQINKLNLFKLNAGRNNKITNVKFMTDLKYLSAYYHNIKDDIYQICGVNRYHRNIQENLYQVCGIDQDGINGLDLINLDAENNYKITNVSFMKSLRFLNASGICGIDQAGIKDLDLIKLDAADNSKISDVSSMKNLSKLHVQKNSGVDQNGISGLNVIRLNATRNSKIFDVRHMKKLEILIIKGSECGIGQQGILGLNLVELYVDNNDKISDLANMSNLKILSASGSACGIDQKGINGLDLVELYASNNPKIKDVSFMKNLKKLYANRGLWN